MSSELISRRLAALQTVEPLIVASGNAATPRALLRLLDDAVPAYRLFMLNAPADIPCRPGVTYETPFVGPGMRNRGRLRYLPCRLSLVPRLLKTRVQPDVVLLNTTRPRSGQVSLGAEVNILPAAIEAARTRGSLVVAQLNRCMPYTRGNAEIPLDCIDFAIEVDEPLDVREGSALTGLHAAIAERTAALVPERACLQAGIGAVPDAVLTTLIGRRDLRIWSEMISDGMLALAHAGALADTPAVTSFATGTAELYDWLDNNSSVIFARTETVNDSAQISRRRGMTAINTAMQVDLFGQANASHVPGHVHSGAGGQDDFVDGAIRANGGRAILALPAWHGPSNASTIVGRLAGPAASFQPSYVVTDVGAARVWGQPESEQTYELIERAAAPVARDELWDVAVGFAAGMLDPLRPQAVNSAISSSDRRGVTGAIRA